MVRVISWGFPDEVLEAEGVACTCASACVRLELLIVSVISWLPAPPLTNPVTWLKSWEPRWLKFTIHCSAQELLWTLSTYRENLPAVSCSERPAIVIWAGVMVDGCRPRLVRGWRTTLADTDASPVDIRWLPEWRTRPVSTLRGCERRPPCCRVCWRRAWSICAKKNWHWMTLGTLEDL